MDQVETVTAFTNKQERAPGEERGEEVRAAEAQDERSEEGS